MADVTLRPYPRCAWGVQKLDIIPPTPVDFVMMGAWHYALGPHGAKEPAHWHDVL
ncbi:MAG: hypothetical protein GDA52_00235 [Rhodobacteraceae bacterium]|nr:hypothetical protein [Paracoccaceae bacterium]